MAKYKEFGNFSSFKDFGSAAKEAENQQKEQLANEKFEQVAKGKFPRIIKGNFRTALPGLVSVSIIPVELKDGRWTVNVIPFYLDSRGKEAHTTLRLEENGQFTGQLPKDATVSKTDLKIEVLEIIEKENVGFWHATDQAIIPEKDILIGEEEVLEQESGTEQYVDPGRLSFYSSQPGVLFGAVSRRDGFDGYKLVYFNGQQKDFIVLDNDNAPNAAFILDLDKNHQLPKTIDSATVEKHLAQVWSPIVAQARTKRELKRIGAVKIVHNETWKRRMQEQINARLSRRES
jgi:hypothetical protein